MWGNKWQIQNLFVKITNMKKNSIHAINITSYSSEGEGIGRIDGMAVFVKGGLVGETLEVKITKVGKNCAWARLNKVLKASSARVKPDCKFALSCGGCSLRHMNYEEELQLKLRRINDALQRIGKLDYKIKKIHGADNILRYRNKATFPVGYDKNKNFKIGIFQQRSHNIIGINECLIQSEEAEYIVAIVRKWLTTYKIPAYNEENRTGLVRHIFVRTNYENEVLVCLVTTKKEIPHLADLITLLENLTINIVGLVQNIQNKNTNVIFGKQFNNLWKENYITDKILDLDFRLSVASFFQVNRAQAEKLYTIAMSFADIQPNESVVDLYCGTGTITLLMSKKAQNVIGVEIVPEAISDTKQNAKINSIDNVEFICADAKTASEDFANKEFRPDIICVDPPRKGLDTNTISSIIKISPKRIVYISCDPATLARDLQIFSKSKYKITKAEVVDMFPRTPHIETVVLLTK